MQTYLCKVINLTLDAGDLVRLFRVLEYLNHGYVHDSDVGTDAKILFDELSEVYAIIGPNAPDPKSISIKLNIDARYERNTETISLGDILIPGEDLPPVTPLDDAPALEHPG